MSGLTVRIKSRMFKLLSGILSKGSDRKDQTLSRGRSARHLPVRKRHREHEWLEMRQLTRQPLTEKIQEAKMYATPKHLIDVRRVLLQAALHLPLIPPEADLADLAPRCRRSVNAGRSSASRADHPQTSNGLTPPTVHRHSGRIAKIILSDQPIALHRICYRGHLLAYSPRSPKHLFHTSASLYPASATRICATRPAFIR